MLRLQRCYGSISSKHHRRSREILLASTTFCHEIIETSPQSVLDIFKLKIEKRNRNGYYFEGEKKRWLTSVECLEGHTVRRTTPTGYTNAEPKKTTYKIYIFR